MCKLQLFYILFFQLWTRAVPWFNLPNGQTQNRITHLRVRQSCVDWRENSFRNLRGIWEHLPYPERIPKDLRSLHLKHSKPIRLLLRIVFFFGFWDDKSVATFGEISWNWHYFFFQWTGIKLVSQWISWSWKFF